MGDGRAQARADRRRGRPGTSAVVAPGRQERQNFFPGVVGWPGRRQEAQEHLTIATTMYREMDMRFWLEKAAMKQL